MPLGFTADTFVIQRNHSLAGFLAKLTGRKYQGDLSLNTKIDSRDILFPHKSLPVSAGEELGVTSQNQIFGSVIEPIYAEKSIFHPLINKPEVAPRNFPHKFPKQLFESKATLPGYTVFCLDDALSAFELLKLQGVVVRLKDPQGSSGTKQLIVASRTEVEEFVKSIDPSKLKALGLVLESNLINSSDPKAALRAYSAGWTVIDGKIYSYIGEQMFGETGTVDRYLGTKLYMVRGTTNNLIDFAKEKKLQSILQCLSKVKRAMVFLPYLIGSRINFDFLVGIPETLPANRYIKERTYVVEQSFRVGGATPAELLGIQYLNTHKNAEIVTAISRVHYGSETKSQISTNSEIFLRTSSDPIYKDVQVWSYIEEI